MHLNRMNFASMVWKLYILAKSKRIFVLYKSTLGWRERNQCLKFFEYCFIFLCILFASLSLLRGYSMASVRFPTMLQLVFKTNFIPQEEKEWFLVYSKAAEENFLVSLRWISASWYMCNRLNEMLEEFSHASKCRSFSHDLSNISTVMKGRQASRRWSTWITTRKTWLA